MTDKFAFKSAGEIQEVEFALARNGWTHPLLKTATAGNFFGLVREVLEGRAEIVRIERLSVVHDTAALTASQYTIDCDAKPFEPSGLTVAPDSEQLPGRVRGQFVFDGQIGLYLSEHQQRGYLTGHQLRNELANESVLPANVLDFYLANKHLVPKELKGKAVFFWGTIYRGAGGGLCVRYLFFSDGAWHSNYCWLDYGWSGYGPAALRAS